MKSHYQDLEEQVEYWRYRAEEAEAKLSRAALGFVRTKRIPGLTPSQSAIMQLLAIEDLTRKELHQLLEDGGMEMSQNVLKVHICKCRKVLPAHLAPTLVRSWHGKYQIPDRDALNELIHGKAAQ